jgi:hypothetical protein
MEYIQLHLSEFFDPIKLPSIFRSEPVAVKVEAFLALNPNAFLPLGPLFRLEFIEYKGFLRIYPSLPSTSDTSNIAFSINNQKWKQLNIKQFKSDSSWHLRIESRSFSLVIKTSIEELSQLMDILNDAVEKSSKTSDSLSSQSQDLFKSGSRPSTQGSCPNDFEAKLNARDLAFEVIVDAVVALDNAIASDQAIQTRTTLEHLVTTYFEHKPALAPINYESE